MGKHRKPETCWLATAFDWMLNKMAPDIPAWYIDTDLDKEEDETK